VGLLTTPKYLPDPATGGFYSNHVTAYVRAVSGAASEKAPQDNQTVRESAFAYQLTSEVIPFFAYTGPWTNYADFLSQSAGNNRSFAGTLSNNAYEIRLRFQWPLRPPYDYTDPPRLPEKIGNSGQTFRAMIGGTYDYSVDKDLGFIRPGKFARAGGGGP
jgi:hypothetical protein